MFSQRSLNFFGFVCCTGLVAAALYFQYVDGLDPCPLCIFQRIAFILMGAIFLIAFLHNPKITGMKVYGALATVVGLIGIVIAARHVWLQNAPEDQVPECGPGLDFMIEVLPFRVMLEKVLMGSGECAEVSWTFLSLSMPTWSLIWLLILTAIAVMLVLSRK
ncbi:MAG: disulfide bond formation protein B [Gammaproteobacteria bacterium]|nr:disulfide bond formation protein B [Gammaproteobacteria bacterium]MCY4219173.1 disulfide bond formation protein B [Gammaproteobacteria bacterium]MCY4275522.1 disulfide bond formation protein B [Gammaproteobacteria bacterium]